MLTQLDSPLRPDNNNNNKKYPARVSQVQAEQTS